MGPWELGDFTVAKRKMHYNIHGPPVDWGPYDSVWCVYHSSVQLVSCSTTFYDHISQRSKTHVYQNITFKKDERVTKPCSLKPEHKEHEVLIMGVTGTEASSLCFHSLRSHCKRWCATLGPHKRDLDPPGASQWKS